MNAITQKPLAVGTYKTTETFKQIDEHIAVMFDDDQTLVAVVGAKDELPAIVAESLVYAHLFAAAPKMQEALRKIYMADPRQMATDSFVEFVHDLARDAFMESCLIKPEGES